MKPRLLASALLLALAPVAAMAGDPVEGIWKTEAEDGAFALVTIAPCADRFCGVISRTFNASGEYQSPNRGKPIVWDMKADGGGSYSGGQIWQPSTGKTYTSKMSLSGSTLKVSGCVGPICKKQSWTRAE